MRVGVESRALGRWEPFIIVALLLLSCTPTPSRNDHFRQDLDSGCTSYASCHSLVQQAIERSKSCRENDPAAVSCAEARADYQLAVALFEPYERSAAYQARVDQERREREETARRQAEARQSEEAIAQKEAERLRAEEQARATEAELRVRRYAGMTAAERQQTLLDCYRGRLQPRLATCDDVLSELLAVATSEQERQALSGTRQRMQDEVDIEIEKLRREDEAFARQKEQEHQASQAAAVGAGKAAAAGLSDAQIRKRLIAESIESYSGNCPCPYNTDRAGRSCGKRSAYSRPGGEAPLCFDSDVTPEMIAVYRQQIAGN